MQCMRVGGGRTMCESNHMYCGEGAANGDLGEAGEGHLIGLPVFSGTHYFSIKICSVLYTAEEIWIITA